ncbi:30S ribosomal protein S6 [Coriobacteriia bacterium Es71-Z0120]|uniref:30S ribosomal protein S6 n=1 Tax=Parvivirga hydrogeniphila TaxID=2939460 RepID=UPI002260D091|nr:30S ribosomal protein S6 [Parvivirga hydrogeniphila]MCL4078140.1 30S ribosomal protein S6 [Parvivirga hydrogeniphila]
MKAYEVMLIINPSLDDDGREALLSKVRGVITAAGGVVDSEDAWGKRKLAYEIAGLSEADYHVLMFHADAATVAELDRVLKITDPVVRFKIIRRDDLD